MGTENKKGDLLEEAVKLAYSVPGLSAETKASVPSALIDSERVREVDVLLSSKTLPVQVAIECKNYGDRVGPSQIDQFVGLLHDIGLPHSQGLFIASHNGFTESAHAYAREAGIQTLLLEGLTADRLSLAVNLAVQSMVFLVGTTNITMFPMTPPGSAGGIVLEVKEELNLGGIYTHLWGLWMQGRIPAELGNPAVCIRHGGGVAICDFFIEGHAASLPGLATHLVVRDVETGGVVRERVKCEFDAPEGEHALKLTRFTTEEALQKAIDGAVANVRVVHRIQVPRLALHGEGVYWPPTREAAERVATLRREGKPVSLPAVEGTNIYRAWDHIKRRTKDPRDGEAG